MPEQEQLVRPESRKELGFDGLCVISEESLGLRHVSLRSKARQAIEYISKTRKILAGLKLGYILQVKS